MLVVGVAGGTGDVGRTIVEELVRSTKFKIVVLTRVGIIILPRSPKNLEPHDGIVSVPVNYNNVASLAHRLEENAVHTVISTMSMGSDEISQSQINLIWAADESTTTKRFIPSEYAHINTPELLDIDPTTQWWLDAVDCLKRTKLQYTRFAPGFFMDYWGMPHVKTNLKSFTFGIDMADCQAAIPGDGNSPLSLTYSRDHAKFVVRTLELDEWSEFSVGVGDDLSFNEMLRLAEESRGKKFQVTYDSVERLNEGKVTMLPMPKGAPFPEDEMEEYIVLFGYLTIREAFRVPVENRLNGKFPDLRPLTFKEFLNETWGKGVR